MAIKQQGDLESRPTATSMAVPSSRSVLILHGEQKTSAEISAAKIVEGMGAEAVLLRWPGAGTSDATRFWSRVPPEAAIVARASLLAATIPEGAIADTWLAPISHVAAKCFLFDFETDARCARLLEKLTDGSFRVVDQVRGSSARLSVASDQRDICRQLSGLSFDMELTGPTAAFAGGTESPDCTALASIETRPLMLSVRHGNAVSFLVAPAAIADLDEPCADRAPMASLFAQLLPMLMFLRAACGDYLWHNDSPHGCLIIDDPLLKLRHGFLEFEKLVAVMQRERFSASIAFIPWNYRRSNRRAASFFKRHAQHLSLSVHGCDHTGGEFASTDLDFLVGQAARGLQWMAKHRDLTGVDFDDVMVFPQGHFSTVALKALRACGYLAAVNSSGRPTDGAECSLRPRDLLGAAVARFDEFPLFLRHYPDDVVGLAVDLFLGKPALLVEHHGYFREGYEDLSAIVQRLHAMEPRLRWTNLAAVCSRAHLQRRMDDGRLVRFYTDRFRLSNETERSQRYFLEHQPKERPMSSIEIDGVPVGSALQADGMVGPFDVAAGRGLDVRIHRRWNAPVSGLGKRGLAWRTRVFLRRHLSELRDNYVDRSPLLTRIVHHARRRLVEKG